MPVIVIMGVSGSGKSTVGRGLSARLNLPFCEGDDLHPATNIAKMKKGIPVAAR
jgi:gluconokinase